MWYILITMTTEGYGDVFAESHGGRVISIITAFWGTFIVSLFVITMINTLRYDSNEIKSYTLYTKIKKKEELKIEAVNLISAFYRIVRLEKKNSDPNININEISKNLTLIMEYQR